MWGGVTTRTKAATRKKAEVKEKKSTSFPHHGKERPERTHARKHVRSEMQPGGSLGGREKNRRSQSQIKLDLNLGLKKKKKATGGGEMPKFGQ